ncbi:sugar phosphate isomerase/epimerase [Candidatus Bathyarchaeota archaeon]|nr:sugar phosphate isomerase/epimerase [Candidatus Bathyarchaeota archaeon]
MFLSIRDVILRYAGYGSLSEGLKSLGIDSFELYVGRDLKTRPIDGERFNLASRDEAARLKRSLEVRGFRVCALLLANDFSSPDLKQEIVYVKTGLEAAYRLEVRVVRINALMREIQGYGLEEYVDRTVEALEPCIRLCKETGVSLAVENHGVVANRVEFLKALFDRFPDGHLGLTLDTGNFYWFGYPLSRLYEIYETLAPYVKHTHMKNAAAKPGKKDVVRKPREVEMTPLYEGDIALDRVIEILGKTGYDYDLTIEDESLDRFKPEERMTILRKDVEYLKCLLSS